MSTLDSNKLVEVSSVDGLTDASSKGYADTVNPSSIGQSGNFLGVSKANGVKWESRNLSVFPNFTLNSITYGNNLYVMCGDGGVVGTSTDTINWTLRTVGSTNYNSIAYYFENYYYVIAGTNQRISTDGISWSLGTSGFGSSAIRSIVYNNNGLYTAAGGGGTIRTSTNLISWTYRTSGFTTSISTLIYNDGLYFTGGQNGRLSVSTDTITWELKTSGFGSSFISSIIYADGLYVAGGTGGTLATSTNGIFWSKIDTTNLSITDRIEDLTYGNGLYVYGAYYTANNLIVSSAIATSTDTVNWTFRTAQGIYTDSVRYLKYENNNFFAFPESEPKYVAVSSGDPVWSGNATENSIQTAPKGFVEYKVPGSYTFTVPPDANNFYIEAVGSGGGGSSSSLTSVTNGKGGGGGAYYANLINRRDLDGAETIGVVVGSKGLGGGNRIDSSTIWNTLDGFDSPTNSKKYLAYKNNTYFAYSKNPSLNTVPLLQVSEDSITWKVRTLGSSFTAFSPFNDIYDSLYSFNDGLYVCVGASLIVSTDTITWQLRTTGKFNLKSIAYGNQTYVITSAVGGVSTSTDTITWTSRTLGRVSTDLAKVIYENELFFGTTFNRVNPSISTDGIVWTTYSFQIPNTSSNFDFTENKPYIYDNITNRYIFSDFNSINFSTDLINWTSNILFSVDSIYQLRSFVYGNETYLALKSDYYEVNWELISSTDSINWTLRTCFLPSHRYDNTPYISFVNGIYILCYYEFTKDNSSLLVSTDTITWSLRTFGKLDADPKSINYNNGFYFITTSDSNTDSNYRSDTSPLLVSTDTITWQLRTSGLYVTNNGYSISDIEYGNGIYVLVPSFLGRNPPYLISSTDTISWHRNSIPSGIDYTYSTYNPLNIKFKNDLFHLILNSSRNDGGIKLISTDTINWQISTSNINVISYSGDDIYSTIKKIDNEYFFAGQSSSVYDDGGIISTTDFINWKPRTTGFSVYVYDFSYGNGKYVIVEEGEPIYSVSTDSISWKEKVLVDFAYNDGVTFSSFMKDQFVMGGFYGNLNVSTDTIVWEVRSNAGLWYNFRSVYRSDYVNGYFVFADNNVLSRSTDGNFFEELYIPIDGYYSSTVYNDGLYVLNGGSFLRSEIAVSTDLISWQLRTSNFSSGYYTLHYGNGVYVASGNAGNTAVSTDTITWVLRTSGFGSTSAIFGLYANNLHILGGYGSILNVSTDTITWIKRTFGVAGYIRELRYQDNLYFAVTAATIDTLMASTDTITWTSRTIPGSNLGTFYNSLTYQNGIYVLGGGSGTGLGARIATSTDSISWTLRTVGIDLGPGVIAGATSLASSPGKFVATLDYGLIINSTDAITWRQSTSDSIFIDNEGEITDGIYQNGLYLFTNTDFNGVVTSTDLINWTTIALGFFPNSNPYKSYLNYANNLFLYADTENIISTSTNSIHWTLRTNGLPAYPYSKIQYLNGSYVFVGRYRIDNNQNLIFQSTDTIVWELRTSGIPYRNQINDSNDLIVSDGNFVFSAYTTPQFPNLILTSTNGIVWKHYPITYSEQLNIVPQRIKEVNDVYIAFNDNGVDISVSTDLVTWQIRTLGYYSTYFTTDGSLRFWNNLYSATYGNGLYIIGGVEQYRLGAQSDLALVAVSTDTINWVLRTASSPEFIDNVFSSLSFGNNQYLATNNLTNGRIYYSTDTISWSSRTIATLGGYDDSIYVNDTFFVSSSTDIRALTFPVEQGGTSGNASRFNIKTKSILAAGGGNSTFASGGSGGGYPSFPFLVGVNGNNGGDDADVTNPPTDTRKSMGGGAGASGSPPGSAGGLVYNYFYGKEYIISGGSSTGGDGESGVDTGIYLGARGGGGGGAVSSGPNVWTLRTSGFGISSIRTIIYDNSSYLAGGTGGAIRYSTDAITWIARTSGIGSTSISSLLYANGFYLCAGGNSATIDILRASTDSIVWSIRTTGWSGTTNCSIESLAYGNGFYLAGGVTLFKLIASTDTINWTLRTVGGTGNSYNLRSLNGLYFYVGGGLTVSTDTINWESRTSGFGTSLIYDINYINSSYISVGFGGIISVSTDNINWSRRTSGFGTSTISSISFGNGFYLAGGTGGQILLKSTDTITWTKVISNIPSTSSINNDIIYNGNDLSFITSSGNSIATASALVATWSQRTSGFGATSIIALTYGNGFYLAAGTRSLAASTDTINWAFRTSGFGTTFIQTATYGNGFYVVGGGIGTLTVSTNTINWTYRTSGFGVSWIYSLIYDNGFYVASGDTLAVSTDTINWRYRTSGRNGINYLYTSTYGNGFYLTGGFENINASTDTITWIARTSGFGATSISALVYGSGVYVAGGYGATLTTSTDTITWILRTTGLEGTTITSLLYSDGLFVAGSQTANGLFVVSTDAINWEYRVSGFGTSYIGALTYGNNLYVAAGDGITASFSYGYKFAAGKGGDGLYGGGGGGGGLSTGDVEIIAAGGDGGDGYVRITWW